MGLGSPFLERVHDSSHKIGPLYILDWKNRKYKGHTLPTSICTRARLPRIVVDKKKIKVMLHTKMNTWRSAQTFFYILLKLFDICKRRVILIFFLLFYWNLIDVAFGSNMPIEFCVCTRWRPNQAGSWFGSNHRVIKQIDIDERVLDSQRTSWSHGRA